MTAVAAGGVVHVRAHMREGRPVAAHTRAGDGPDVDGQAATRSRFSSLSVRRRSLLDDDFIVLAARRRGGQADPPAADPSGAARRRERAAGPVSPRSQELVDIIAPGGNPVGQRRGGAADDIRTLPGGLRAAEAMFQRLIVGRGAVPLPRPGYPGRMYRLDDGSTIGLRPRSSDGSPGLDINIPGFPAISKLHFSN